MRHAIFASFLALASFSTVLQAAPPATLQEGKNYTLVKPVQPTENSKKIEVLEFFSYGCPHCHDLEPLMSAWEKKQAKDVNLQRVPVAFSKAWEPLSKMYYAFEVLGILDKYHTRFFNAVHQENLNYRDENQLFEWVSKNGGNKTQFIEAYRSFGVQQKAQRARQLAIQYAINGVPTLAIDGKYLTSSSLTGSHETLFPVVDALVQQARHGHR